MDNSELADAITKAWEMTQRTSSPTEVHQALVNHLRAMLDIQRMRAEKSLEKGE